MPHWEEMWKDRESWNQVSGEPGSTGKFLVECGGLALDVFIFLPNGELVAMQWNSRLVPMLLTDCVLSCVYSDKLDTCDLLFGQLVYLFFCNNNDGWVLLIISPVRRKFNMKMLEFYQNGTIPNSAHSLMTPIEISCTLSKVKLQARAMVHA